MRRPVKAVLFDLDDTLFDHSASVAHAISLLRQDHAALQTRPLADVLVEHRRLLEHMHLEVLAGRLSVDQARIDRMRGIFRFCGAEVAHEIAVQSAQLHRQRYRQCQRAVPGAVELLQRLRPLARIAIVTNNLLEEQRAKLAVCGLSSLVDLMVTSEECGHTKPSAEIFRIALDRLGCRAEESVMIGDSWESDIVGAHNAGIRPLWFNRSGAVKRDDQVDEIASFEPVEPVLKWILSAGDGEHFS